MELKEKKNKVFVTNNVETQEFTIKASGKAFAALISSVYKNPILAIIRELSTNAYDAHVEAGHRKAFDVHLPNYSDYTFWIRDYGLGLSPDKIKNVYTVLFESDKTSSNDQVGCWGIGAKSPLAINNNFQVDSWSDGIHYLYNVYKNEDGIPVIALLHKENSSERSGLKVTIKTKDVHSWTTAANSIYQYFEIKPNFIGETKLNITKVDYLLEGKDWKIKPAGHPIKAIMGQVAYEIDRATIPTNLHKLMDVPFDLFFNIGDLSVTLGRDALEMNKLTSLKIKEKLEEIEKELQQKIETEISSSKNLWEARLKYIGLVDTILYYRNISCSYKNIPISNTYIDFKDFDIYQTTYKKLYKSHGTYIKQNMRFYIDDIPRGGKTRFKAAKNWSHVDFYCEFPDAKKQQEFCDLLGFDDSYLIKTSTLPATSYSVSKGKTYKVSKFVQGNSSSWAWEQEDIDFSKIKKGYYIRTLRYNGISADLKTKFTNRDIVSILDFLKSINIKIDTLYGVKKAYVDIFQKKGNFVDIIELADQKFREHYINKPVNFASYVSSAYKQIKNYIPRLNDLVQTCYKLHESNEIDIILRYKNALNITEDLTTIDKTKELNHELKKYPLIDFDRINNKDEKLKKHIIKYIKAVDNNLL